MKQVTKILAGLLALGFSATLLAQVQIGDKTQISGGGTVSVGYSGDYGNVTQSNHGLTFGFGGGFDGYYYNPNFINFNITPYYNQSKADSDYQSLTNASGVAASANFFTGSHFPGSVSYHYDYNSTGTFGLLGHAQLHHPGQRPRPRHQLGGAVSRLAYDFCRLSIRHRQRHTLWHRRGDLKPHRHSQREIGLSVEGF